MVMGMGWIEREWDSGEAVSATTREPLKQEAVLIDLVFPFVSDTNSRKMGGEIKLGSA